MRKFSVQTLGICAMMLSLGILFSHIFPWNIIAMLLTVLLIAIGFLLFSSDKCHR